MFKNGPLIGFLKKIFSGSCAEYLIINETGFISTAPEKNLDRDSGEILTARGVCFIEIEVSFIFLLWILYQHYRCPLQVLLYMFLLLISCHNKSPLAEERGFDILY